MSKKIKEIFNSLETVTVVTAGSVDDGKSTLIGRLLYDCDKIYKDQIASVQKICGGKIDYSLFTDGLEAEREQKITIDVAYRYFSTDTRRFIIADVPGHEQYTRNMATGASKADIALILVDAKNGMTEQTKRHLFIASLFRIPHIVMVINKMDLVGFEKNIFNKIKEQCIDFSSKLHISHLVFIPCSSLNGDMVVKREDNMLWYEGQTIFGYLQNIIITSAHNNIDFRLPVQLVLRPNQNFRGYAGKIDSGAINVGEKIMILPSGHTSVIRNIYNAGKRKKAFSTDSICLSLFDNIDISRGDMIVRPDNLPCISHDIETMICWFDNMPLHRNKRYKIKHTTNDTFGFVAEVIYSINLNTLHRENQEVLNFNQIGKVKLRTQKPLVFDPFVRNKNTGSFIIIDELTNNTVGAGIILGESISNNKINYINNEVKLGSIIWLTGLSGAGKTTIAKALQIDLQNKGVECEHLDGDIFRNELNIGLKYTKADRLKNIKLAGYVANKLAKHGVIVIASFISPYISQREQFKKTCVNFIEVYVKASISICRKRDVKGLYKKAQSGGIKNFTGVSHTYEEPIKPDIVLNTEQKSAAECVKDLKNFLVSKGLI